MEVCNVLLIGSGGREHALAWKLASSEMLGRFYAAPGNPGIFEYASPCNLNVQDHEEIVNFCKENQIGLVVVGPEQPLVDGLVDRLTEEEIPAFGPHQEAAKLEGSKEYSKTFMEQFGIPTASSRTFSLSERDAIEMYASELGHPVVLKADGLAAGKGVIISLTPDETTRALERFETDSSLQHAASRIVVEEFMEGEEASVFVISDGHSSQILQAAQDHKRIGEGDTGPNTGGMGAYCPAPLISPDLMNQIDREIIQPTITGMQVRGCPYTGVLYVGLMITNEGPKVVEYNCRFGDPECQCIMPTIESDLLPILLATTNETLDQIEIKQTQESVCCVVLAAEGYPGSYPKGMPIHGLSKSDASSVQSDSASAAIIFQAGTRKEGDQIVTQGGRVLNVVGRGPSLSEAVNQAYQAIESVSFDRMVYRRDIAQKGLKRTS